MADLIDRQALLRDIEKYHLSDGKFQHWVEVQPSIEAEPVRHGHWAEENGFIYCPFCGDPWGAPGCESMVKSFNYCPNCGARMDGERWQT